MKRLVIVFMVHVAFNTSMFSQKVNTSTTGYVCDIETASCGPATNVSTLNKTNQQQMSEKKKAKLVYYYDALCGWCFGFSPVIANIKETYKDDLTIEVVSGGLFLGNRAGYVNDVAPHIKSGAYKSVEAMTGAKFGETFLKDVFGEGKMTLDSTWSSIALCVVKDKKTESQVAFAKILLDAIYADGMDTIDVDAIAQCATKIGFDANAFKVYMSDPVYKEMAEKEFQNYKQNGIRGMPSLMLETEDTKVLLSNGYVSYKQLAERLDTYLK
ncbi:DsbA family protein [Aquimarina agarivorans]|uniref:DsbA family protein n=1 Tax=Aquimarina agarivorans TaxID=980584 RepID=UPI000248ED5A|nr:DsbA family protein [Aquimarina agarivorans]